MPDFSGAMAAAAMFFGGLDGCGDGASPFVFVVVASQRLTDVLKDLSNPHQQGGRFDLTKNAVRDSTACVLPAPPAMSNPSPGLLSQARDLPDAIMG